MNPITRPRPQNKTYPLPLPGLCSCLMFLSPSCQILLILPITSSMKHLLISGEELSSPISTPTPHWRMRLSASDFVLLLQLAVCAPASPSSDLRACSPRQPPLHPWCSGPKPVDVHAKGQMEGSGRVFGVVVLRVLDGQNLARSSPTWRRWPCHSQKGTQNATQVLISTFDVQGQSTCLLHGEPG